MCILSENYVWTKIVEMMAVELRYFLAKFNSSSTTCRIDKSALWGINYHIGKYILSEIYVWAKIEAVMTI